MAETVFKLKKSGIAMTQRYYFTIVSPGNGKTLATSEMYVSKDGAVNGIKAVHTSLQGSVEYKDETGEQ